MSKTNDEIIDELPDNIDGEEEYSRREVYDAMQIARDDEREKIREMVEKPIETISYHLEGYKALEKEIKILKQFLVELK